MTKPKVLISSTCFDLKEYRTAIEKSLNDLSYEPILSDKYDILYDPNEHTHQACIRAVESCDLVILIIGGRFGGNGIPEAFTLIDDEPEFGKAPKFAEHFNSGKASITQLEILKAFELKIPVFAFVSKGLVSAHLFYEKNKNNPAFNTFVIPNIDKIETAPYICEFINYIRYRKTNNAYFEFEDSSELISIFKKQFSLYFQQLLKIARESAINSTIRNPDYIHAEIVGHRSGQRRRAFDELFEEVDTKDKINILGTGVTSFLNNDEHVEELLQNGNEIKILLVNEQIVKENGSCMSREFFEQLTYTIHSPLSDTTGKLKIKSYCPLTNLNFLVDVNHFDNYYAKKGYFRKVIDSYKLIKDYKDNIEKNGWTGSLNVRHFNSFVPMSITAVFPDHPEQRKLLAEFIIPFTDNRLLLKSSPEQNAGIYQLFIDFFNETWKRAESINFQTIESNNDAN